MVRPRGAGRGHARSGRTLLFSSGADDGQELSNLVISNDDSHVVYVRGGDHDENWSVPLAARSRVDAGAAADAGLVGLDDRWRRSVAR